MEFIANVDLESYDQFIVKNKYAHYTKLSKYASTKKQMGYKAKYCAMLDEGQIVATATIYEKKQYLVKYYYIQMGLCLDYSNINLLNLFLNEIQQMAIKNKVSFIKLSSNIIRDDNSDSIVNNLKSLGYIHKGYTYGYDGSFDNRHTLVIDLDKDLDTIKDQFSKTRKATIKKQNLYCIETSIASKDELNILCEFEKQLSLMKKFKVHDLSYFETLYNNFNDNIVFAISRVDFDKSLEKLDIEINSKKFAKDLEALNAKKKSYQQILEFKNKYGNNYPIAAGLFITINGYSWDLYLYNHKEFNFMSATDAIHIFMIEHMKSKDVKTYDMCGYSGIKDSLDLDYGLYMYKSSFGAQPIEFIGEFTLIINLNKYTLYKKLTRLHHKVKRKVKQIIK